MLVWMCEHMFMCVYVYIDIYFFILCGNALRGLLFLNVVVPGAMTIKEFYSILYTLSCDILTAVL